MFRIIGEEIKDEESEEPNRFDDGRLIIDFESMTIEIYDYFRE